MKELILVRVEHPYTGKAAHLSGDRAKQYKIELAVVPDLCLHPKVAPRRRDTRTLDQCLVCGVQKGNALPRPENFESLELFDEELQPAYRARVEEHRKRINLKFYQAEEASKKADSAAFQIAYDEYLKSPQWREKRKLVLQRANGLCEGCRLAAPTEVHHLTYSHVFKELLFQLVALCRSCHERVHETDGSQPEATPESDLEFDEGPCSGCRYNIWPTCGKFEVKVAEAFAPGGQCHPPGAALEPLR